MREWREAHAGRPCAAVRFAGSIPALRTFYELWKMTLMET